MIRRRHIAIYIEGGHIAPYHIVHIVFHTGTIPFRMAELEEFRTLLVYLNPEIDCWLPSNHETIYK